MIKLEQAYQLDNVRCKRRTHAEFDTNEKRKKSKRTKKKVKFLHHNVIIYLQVTSKNVCENERKKANR